ncbi:hypothetical protein [Candidatus Rhabdochlamydia porcellionis]|jgi:hypothetical protein|uniref:Uncharacterized protein n=1 Tax=Candidatus Rhabdochlamydia porcellionis TaxID=225148 RepID=A0ABX8YY67_9BACT|nr:hypothetical protein [Candidatus Rhabdochlamydia porcellionis]QZA58229.1 hypothetical protein RHAB15C_0000099 [Candidatus Rhabdochlamydia porcellionis]
MEIHQRITNLSSIVETASVKPVALDKTTSRVSDFFSEKNSIIGNRSSLKTNQPNFAAKHLIGTEELAPYFAGANRPQDNAAAAAVAVVTVLLITKSGRDPDDFQLPIDPENAPTEKLDIDQLLEMRQNILNN